VGTATTGTANGTGMVAATREQLLQQQQQLLQRRSDKPPKLPPRDNSYPHDIPKVSESSLKISNVNARTAVVTMCTTAVIGQKYG
jgi:hypothetical protein